jgi:competence protein ComEC
MRLLTHIYLIFFLLGLSYKNYAQEDSVMYAHYINVGQAAAVLLEFPCGAVLIDAGAQDDNYQKELLNFLNLFFVRRKDLNRTLALLMVTHPHIDHNEALVEVAQQFRVERYIDDGLRVGSGRVNQKWMQDQTSTSGIQYQTWTYEEITKGGNQKGKTNRIIDPVNCPNGDPKIILYFGRFSKQPSDWSASDFKNYNNHSLVIKVLFGKASFLFTGDLEKKGIRTLVNTYGASGELDVDILMVGHHAANNATTEDFLEAVTPTHAVIACGDWEFGSGKPRGFNTYSYGHPRISTLQMLQDYIKGRRRETIRVQAGEGARDFRPMNISQRIYATAWDQTISVRATLAGTYRVQTGN